MKLPPFHSKPETAPLGWEVDPGFGFVCLTCDGATVLDIGDGSMTVQDFEDRAAGDPDHDWRFEVHAPLRVSGSRGER
jgi:hypothetical protein